MGFRFRKSVTIMPGVRVNVGKKSTGISVGGKGAGMSFNTKTGATARVSATGTGLSYSQKIGASSKRERHHKTSAENHDVEGRLDLFLDAKTLRSLNDEAFIAYSDSVLLYASSATQKDGDTYCESLLAELSLVRAESEFRGIDRQELFDSSSGEESEKRLIDRIFKPVLIASTIIILACIIVILIVK